MSTGARLLVEVGEELHGADWPAALADQLPYSEGYLRSVVVGVDRPWNMELSNQLRRLVLREHYAIGPNSDAMALERKDRLAALAHRLMLPDWRIEGEGEPGVSR